MYRTREILWHKFLISISLSYEYQLSGIYVIDTNCLISHHLTVALSETHQRTLDAPLVSAATTNLPGSLRRDISACDYRTERRDPYAHGSA